MGENSSLSWELHRHVLLVAQNPGLPKNADWAKYMEDVGTLKFRGVLVVGNGNKLSATQRSDVEQLLKRNGARNAVMTSSAVSRGVMTALSWLGLPVKAFAPTDLTGALAYLDVGPEHQSEIQATLKRLQRALRGPPAAVAPRT